MMLFLVSVIFFKYSNVSSPYNESMEKGEIGDW